jgi:hypothetical protein
LENRKVIVKDEGVLYRKIMHGEINRTAKCFEGELNVESPA